MKTALRIAALFVVYGTLGFGGDYVVGLLAQDARNAPVEVEVQPLVDVKSDVVVEVLPTVMTRVQVRHAGACEFEAEQDFTLPIQNLGELSLDHGAGDLHVEGQDGLTEIVVSARMCASHEEYLEALQVTASDRDGRLDLQALYPRDRDRWNGRNVARIDMTVLIPTGIDVSIDDSSGDLVVSGAGDLHVDDSSGSIEVFDIRGSLVLDDSSGDLEVRDVRGDVRIADGSGSLRVVGVGGAVMLRDGSGGIDVSDVAEDVRIESDGSGGIDVERVGGDFVVDRDGSGGIRHRGVEGRIDVPRKR